MSGLQAKAQHIYMCVCIIYTYICGRYICKGDNIRYNDVLKEKVRKHDHRDIRTLVCVSSTTMYTTRGAKTKPMTRTF